MEVKIRLVKDVVKKGLITSGLILSFISLPISASAADTIANLVIDANGGVNTFDTNNNDFDILLQAVSDAGLVPTLSDPVQSLTVFAPNDGAFLALASDLAGHPVHDETTALSTIATGLSNLGIVDVPSLITNVLLYHVSAGEQDLLNVQSSPSIVTLFDGQTFEPQGNVLQDKDPGLQDPAIVAGDLFTGNGVVHVIDRVLIPANLTGSQVDSTPTLPNIVELVLTSNDDGIDEGNLNDFDILLQAVLAAGLDGALSDPNLNATVFAPTDGAFIKLARDLGYPGHDEQGSFDFIAGALPIDTITNVLLYHVSPGEKTYRDIRHSRDITTLFNDETFHVFWGQILVDKDPGIINPRLVRNANLEAANGRVQVINRVLIPANLTGKTVGRFQWFRAIFSKI